MTDPNRPEPAKPFKPKNFRRIFASCKGETLTDKGVRKAEPCKGCGLWSKKKVCRFCGTERTKP